MDLSKLIATGMTQQQALAYSLLIEKGELTPPLAAKELNLTRSNCYKILDKLVEFGLASKQEISKKFVYRLTNPQALTNLASEQRNLANQREEAVRNVLSDLASKYRSHNNQPDVTIINGKSNVADAYRAQANQKKSIYFLRSQLDIATMGFDTMHEIRNYPRSLGSQRYGITPDKGTVSNSHGDASSNLARTWVKQEDYTAPVEWSVSGSSLLIVVFDPEPHAVVIDSPVIAEAFTQMWHIMNSCLKSMPDYQKLPR